MGSRIQHASGANRLPAALVRVSTPADMLHRKSKVCKPLFAGRRRLRPVRQNEVPMLRFSDGRTLLTFAVIAATLLGAWMFAYEPVGPNLLLHRNRITGAVCPIADSCWFRSN